MTNLIIAFVSEENVLFKHTWQLTATVTCSPQHLDNIFDTKVTDHANQLTTKVNHIVTLKKSFTFNDIEHSVVIFVMIFMT